MLTPRRKPRFQLQGTARQSLHLSGGLPTHFDGGPLNLRIQFTCRHCDTRYIAVRTESPIERAYRLYCQVCRDLLHDDTGFYSLSELLMIVEGGERSEITRYRQEAERCLRLAATTVDPVERETLLQIAHEWLRLAQTAEN